MPTRRHFLGTAATALAAGALAPRLCAASSRDTLVDIYARLDDDAARPMLDVSRLREPVAGRLRCPPGPGFDITLDPHWLSAAQVP